MASTVSFNPNGGIELDPFEPVFPVYFSVGGVEAKIHANGHLETSDINALRQGLENLESYTFGAPDPFHILFALAARFYEEPVSE